MFRAFWGVVAGICVVFEGVLDAAVPELFVAVDAARVDLSVPKTLSTSCDEVVFVDQTTDASLSSDPVLTEIDRLG